jgi:diguanylate cyclase (GGDEF)-like protein
MLDIRTLVVMLVFSSLLMAITLTVGIKTGRPAGFSTWNTGLGLLALGWVLVAFRGVLPDFITIALADGIMITGLTMELAAIIEFGGGTVRRLLLFVPGLLVFVLLLPLTGNYAHTTLLMTVALVLLFAAIAVAALRLGPQAGPGRSIMASVCVVSAVMVTVRAAEIALTPERYPDVYAGSFIQELTFFAMLASTIVVPVGFLLLHHERDESELQRLATVDALTGLFNRRAFVDMAVREIARAQRQKSPFAVLMIDLDLFKLVNDDFGHQAGDRVLAGFAAMALNSVRTEDLVGRYGGEEFCILLPGATMQTATAIAERLRSAVSQCPLGDLPRVTTVSIGVAACNGGTTASLDSAIRHADDALYRAKNSGRNRVVGVDDAAAAQAGDPGRS